MNKRIGILTQPLQNNYGGLLQNYALQIVLKRLGFEPTTIDHRSIKLKWYRQMSDQTKCYLRHWLKPKVNKAPKYQLTERESKVIGRYSLAFVNKYISHTKPFTSVDELKHLVNEGNYSGYVVGSDQCWRPSYSGGFLKEMFFSFIDGSKDTHRIAYAASFGTDQWEFSHEMAKECARLAKQFDCVTVREDSGIRLCKEYFGIEAKHVLDPTMLLIKEDYIKLVEEEKEPESPGDLFYYILDPTEEKKAFINTIASAQKLTPCTVLPRCQAECRTRWDVKHRIEDCVYPSVTTWLRGFMDAKMTVVDSFHGTVFSIIFNKPFWVISNSERGNARFSSLLKLFDLEDRLINSTNVSELDFQRPINWDKVNSIREQMICESIKAFEFLK